MKTPEIDKVEFNATGADGTHMRFTSNLLNFLANRRIPRKFHLSDWLQALDNEMLYHLRELARMALDDPESMGTTVDDIVSLVIHILAAERQTVEVNFRKDQLGHYISMLHHLAALERLRRNGLLAYKSFMSIEPEAANEVVIPQDAIYQADEIRREIMQSMH